MEIADNMPDAHWHVLLNLTGIKYQWFALDLKIMMLTYKTDTPLRWFKFACSS